MRHNEAGDAVTFGWASNDDELPQHGEWDEFCLRCMEDFRYDDCGGYNPPCACGEKCRSCCDASCERRPDPESGCASDGVAESRPPYPVNFCCIDEEAVV